MPPVAVTFDFWDTLVRAPGASAGRAARHRRLTAWFTETGRRVEGPALDEALADVRRRYDVRWVANESYTGDEAVADLVSLLGLNLDAAEHEQVALAFTGAASGDLPALTDHVADVLGALQGRGVKLGIVCDVGLVSSPVLRSYLDRHGVLERFDHWSFSDEVGVYKPDPRIFQHALDGLGVDDPATAAHIGDLRRTDVAGARAFGMTAVRYAGSNDDLVVPDEGDRAALGAASVEPADLVEAHHVIADHRDLLTVLDLA